MKIVLPLLAGMARAGAVAEPTDRLAELDLANALIPITVLPLPTDQMGVSTNTAVLNQSFHLKNEFNRINLAAASNLVATLAKGLWRLNAFASLASNFNQATIIPALRLSLNYAGAGTNMAIISLHGVGQNPPFVVSTLFREVDVLVTADGCQIFEDIIATNGVATNNLIGTWDLQANKLL